MNKLTIDVILNLSDSFGTDAKGMAEAIFDEQAIEEFVKNVQAVRGTAIQDSHFQRAADIDRCEKGQIRVAIYRKYPGQSFKFYGYEYATKYSDLQKYCRNSDISEDEMHYLYKQRLVSEYGTDYYQYHF